MHYDPAEYLYASARIRAVEARLLDGQRFGQLLSMASADELLDALLENGGEKAADRGGSATDRLEAFAEQSMRNAFLTVKESVPDPTLIRFLQYPYDCHNLKTLEKCRHKGLDPAKLLIDLGSVSKNTLLTVSEKDYLPLFPPYLAAAVEQCRVAFGKTADPQDVDFILDRAAFADMAAAAAPFPLAGEWVTKKIDLTNLLLCLRLLRMNNGELGRSLLTRAALDGGSLDLTLLSECYDGGEEVFFQAIAHTPYAGVFEKDSSLAQAEKAADDHLMALIRKAKAIPFGAEVPVAFLLAAEAESKNLRILLAGKKAGLDRDTIQSRMRACYV